MSEQNYELPTHVLIRHVRNPTELFAMLDDLYRQTRHANILGLDCEWKHDLEDAPISIMQLATHHTVYLVHIKEFPVFPSALGDMLRDEKFIKVGCGLDNDLQKLNQHYDVCVSPRTIVDLNFIARCCRMRAGLSNICQQFFGLPLDKTLAISDWSSPRLSEEQCKYAALDAWISRKIFWDGLIGNLTAFMMDPRFDHMTNWISYCPARIIRFVKEMMNRETTSKWFVDRQIAVRRKKIGPFERKLLIDVSLPALQTVYTKTPKTRDVTYETGRTKIKSC